MSRLNKYSYSTFCTPYVWTNSVPLSIQPYNKQNIYDTRTIVVNRNCNCILTRNAVNRSTTGFMTQNPYGYDKLYINQELIN